MVKLEIEEYCDNCPEFDAHVEKDVLFAGNSKKYFNTNITCAKEQLDVMVREKIGEELVRIKREATDEAVNTALTLLLTLPLEVLMDHFWKKSYPQKIPKFADLLIEYYEKWQDGELDLDELKEDLWKYGGVKFREGQINGK